MAGWLEVELDGGAVLHRDGRPVPLVTAQGLSVAGWDGRAVRVRGQWRPPWHPRGRPLFRADSIGAWSAVGVDAPGTAPLRREWTRLRIAGRAALRRRVSERFPDHAGLVAALLIADRSALSPEVRDRFTRAGTAHLLAISGFHVGILAGWILLLLGVLRVPPRHRPWTAVAAIWVYVALIGLPTSAVRAAAIVTILAVGRYRGRPVHPIGAWATALAAVAWMDPVALRGPGAQLSFAGSLGLLLWARSWARRIGGERPEAGAPRGRRVAHALGVAVAVSAAAQVATAPLVAWHFQRVPLAGLPASVVATPLVAAALPGAILALVSPTGWIAAPFAIGARALLDATTAVVGLMASGPGTLWAGPPVFAALGAGAGAGLVVHGAMRGWGAGVGARDTLRRAGAGDTLHGRARRRGPARLRAAAVGAWCGLLLLPVAAGILPRPVEIHILDVGQGDAILVRSPRGAWTLVDAGPEPADDLLRALARRGVHRLEALVVTHPDLDHVGGATEVVRTLATGMIVGPGMLRGTEAMADLVAAARSRGVPWRIAEPGESWSTDGVEWRVVHAGGAAAAVNDHSVVLHLRYGAFDALLTGDVTSSVEDRLPGRLGAGTSVEVLKVAHHGSATSTSEALLDALEPAVGLVSVGRRNRFGHPSPLVVRRFARRGIPLLRTDVGGDLRVRGWKDGSFRSWTRYGPPSPSPGPRYGSPSRSPGSRAGPRYD